MSQQTTALPVIEIDGKDYGLTKLPGKYLFTGEDTEEVVIAEAVGPESWILTTENGRAGSLHREGNKWVLYEGPVSTRHVMPFGLDNSMIHAARIVIEKEIHHAVQ